MKEKYFVFVLVFVLFGFLLYWNLNNENLVTGMGYFQDACYFSSKIVYEDCLSMAKATKESCYSEAYKQRNICYLGCEEKKESCIAKGYGEDFCEMLSCNVCSRNFKETSKICDFQYSQISESCELSYSELKLQCSFVRG